ncbi:MAG: hypothetical protein Kow0069_27540 [Promethearchaeota archaeon]
MSQSRDVLADESVQSGEKSNQTDGSEEELDWGPLEEELEWDEVEGKRYVVASGGTLYVNPEVLLYGFECDFEACTLKCCDEGCWVTTSEKWRVHGMVREFVKYLKDVPDHPFHRSRWKFWDQEPEDGLWHVFTHDGRCVFQRPDGRCVVHMYCLDEGVDWIEWKFNICVTFPLDITHEGGVHYVDFLDDHELFLEKVDCLERAAGVPGKVTENRMRPRPRKRRPIVESCRDVLVNRLGEERYGKLLELQRRFDAYVKEQCF